MSPVVRRILDDMFVDVYVATNEFEAMAAVAVALIRLGDVNAVDTTEVIRVLRERYFEISRRLPSAPEREEELSA